MKLQKKFFLIFLLISIIPILIFSIYTYTRYTNLIDKQVKQSAENLMDVASFQADYTLSNLEHIVEAMYLPKEDHVSMVDNLKKYAGRTQPTDYDIYLSNEKLNSTCQDFIYFSPYINGVFLFTPSGNILGYGYGNGINISHDYDPTNDSWYQETIALEGSTYIYGPKAKDFFESSSPSISFCTALYDVHTRDFLGILMIDCKPEVFDLATVNTMPETASLSVMQKNTPLYITQSQRLTAFKTGDSLLLERDLNLADLTLHASINRDLLYNEFSITQITLIFLTVTCILAFLIISILLSKSLTKPITYLSSQMARSDGKYDVSDSPYFAYRNEIGTLYNSFQEMLDERNRYIKNELENKLILMDSQMKSLESQINAHFLYNTLEAINSIAAIHKVSRICTMTMALGSMFRYSIKTKSELVSVREELEHVENYIAIQQIRFDYGFSYEIHIPNALREMKVLKLILQPLVENALYHGLNYCRAGDLITVDARQENNRLFIFVTDNGRGMTEEALTVLQNQLSEKPEFKELGRRHGQSIGVKNIHTRISLYYGEYYGLQIFSKTGQGTMVQITLPVMDG